MNDRGCSVYIHSTDGAPKRLFYRRKQVAKNHQDWYSQSWVWPNGDLIPVSAMELDQILKAIWATYLLIKYNPKFDWVIQSPLFSALMSKMRDNVKV